MIELDTLGSMNLRESGVGDMGSVLAQPKRMALLVYLAIARPRGFHQRNTLLALFWPEQDEQHSRWSLNQGLHYLREELGSGAVRSRGSDEVGLDPQTILCDAVSFETACTDGKWEAALKLYQGDLLQGFHIPGSFEFEQWLDNERTRLKRLASRAAWALADSREAESDLMAAAEAARRAIQFFPFDETGIRRLIDLLDRAGDRAAAVQAYEEYVRRLRDEVDVEPAPETQAVIARIRSRAEAATISHTALKPITTGIDVNGLAPPVRPGPTHVRTARPWTVRRFLVPGGGILTLAVVVWWAGRAPSIGSSAPRSLAVLPCTSSVQDAEKPYLGELVTQDLITEVAKRRLFEKVIASESIDRYRGSTQSPETIGRELGVEALLYCEYRQTASQEFLKVKLVGRQSTDLLWTAEFRRELALASAATLPTAVVDALSRVIGAERPVDVPSTLAPDLGALNLYKEGQYFLNKVTENDVHRSISLFNEALAHDSTFALPHVGLASAYQLLGIAFGSMEPREAFPLMKQAAERALALDDGLAEAHTLLGEYEIAFGWNWTVAESHLRRAIQLDPYGPHPLQSLAYFLTIVGRYAEVPQLSSRAIAMSPVDPSVWANAGRNYFLAGRFDDALPFLQKGLELAPNYPPLLLEAGHLAVERGQTRRGVEYLQRAESLSGHQVIIRGRLGYAYALSGNSAAARTILRQLKSIATGSRPPAKTATAIAVVYIGLGERDSAFAWLDVAFAQRSGNLVHVLRSPSGWRRLGPDPRYHALLDRLGLEPLTVAPVVTTTAKNE